MNHSERFLRIVDAARVRVREISPEEALTRIEKRDNVLLIDTREDHEWERGYVAGAMHLSRGLLERDIEKVAPDTAQEIILYCGGGFRSILAADSLAQMGYTNVRSMSTGWKGWQVRGLPVAGIESPDHSGDANESN
ncbi:MAG: sulfurtransferase [bacterium]|nr:sulfurtransferase [Candidatus Kapabacteria bacterium]